MSRRMSDAVGRRTSVVFSITRKNDNEARPFGQKVMAPGEAAKDREHVQPSHLASPGSPKSQGALVGSPGALPALEAPKEVVGT